MSSITTQRGAPSMTAPTTQPSHAALWQHRIASLDYAALALWFIRLSSLFLCLCFVLMLILPDMQIGMLQFIQRDTRLLPHIADMAQRRTVIVGLFAGVFFADVCQRVTAPVRWTHLTSLSGFALLAIAALWYFINGQLSPIGVALYIGPFALSLALMASILQRRTPLKYLTWIEDNLLRIISSIFALLAFGLWVQPDAAITTFVTERYGGIILVAIILVFVWSHGQLRHNHLPAWMSIRRVVGLVLFTGIMSYFLIYDPNASLLGFLMSLYLFILCLFTVTFQASVTRIQEPQS